MYKEFWIHSEFGLDYLDHEWPNQVDICNRGDYWDTNQIHVIEYSAYQKLEAELARYKELLRYAGECGHGRLVMEIEALKAENERLREALKFYSHPVSYHTHHEMGYGLQKSADKLSCMDVDSGEIARKALEEAGEE